MNFYNNFQMIPAKVDEFGREIAKPVDIWGPRRGVALALTQLAPLLESDVIGELVEFFVQVSLGDRMERVRKEMLTAALKVVDLHGKVCSINYINYYFSQFYFTRILFLFCSLFLKISWINRQNLLNTMPLSKLL